MPRIKIVGDHATVTSVSWKEQSRMGQRIPLVRRNARHSQSPQEELALGIAHILYPQQFPKLIASGINPKTGQFSNTTFLKQIKLTRTSQKGIETFYNISRTAHTISPKKWKRDIAKFRRHSERVQKRAKELASKIAQESGIQANWKPMNVGEKPNGELVFFEVPRVNLEQLEKRIRAMPNGTHKDSGLEILEKLKKSSQGKKEIRTHGFRRG
ncbi:hypothetical protein KKE06_05470 [Candidatus Micrarchaeota archaeon]|nr:hypothetical protein [Candidatus Micrarchaeota archaeon]